MQKYILWADKKRGELDYLLVPAKRLNALGWIDNSYGWIDIPYGSNPKILIQIVIRPLNGQRDQN